MKKFIIIWAAILVTLTGNAQAPNKMSYQAVIRNTSNVLVSNQIVGMKISILQGSANGTAVYVETQTSTTNYNGLISIEIGNGSVLTGTFSSIVWSNGPYFIKTETDPAGGTAYSITGTSQLLSVPYALYAAESGNSTPGPQGPQGVAGTAGTNGISIQWLGTYSVSPISPTLNQAYYNSASAKSFVWDGSTWQILAQDGAPGLSGNSWSITSADYNGDGSLSLTTTVPSTISSSNKAWLLGGNATSTLQSLGTSNAQPFNVITSNVERFRITSNGRFSLNSVNPVANALFAAYGTGYPGAITSVSGVTDWPINGYSTSFYGGVYGENTGTGVGVFGNASGGTSGTGVYGKSGGNGVGSNGVFGEYIGTSGNGIGVRGQATFNTTSSIGVGGFNVGSGIGVYGQSTAGTGVYGYGSAGGDGVVGQGSTNNSSVGVYGVHTFSTGTGVLGVGNNNSYGGIAIGSGGAFGGKDIGVVGRVVQDSTVGIAFTKAGGFFMTNSSVYCYVGAVNAANVVRKIEGMGTVNTIVKDLNGKKVLLSAPEAPENLFEDYGVGQLSNGISHVIIDPVFSKNIIVNEQHPLKVFIQLEGECNGVYVDNKTAQSFDVIELMRGNSNAKFSWHIVANRADEVLNDGSVSKYSAERFAPASEPLSEIFRETKKLPEAAKVIEGHSRK